MHFSRNPPGPNTSCIEGLAGSRAGRSAARCGMLLATLGSSSIGTYSRSAVLAARLIFAPEESPAGLDTRFARNPHSLSPNDTERPVTITYPFAPLRHRSFYRQLEMYPARFTTFRS